VLLHGIFVASRAGPLAGDLAAFQPISFFSSRIFASCPAYSPLSAVVQRTVAWPQPQETSLLVIHGNFPYRTGAIRIDKCEQRLSPMCEFLRSRHVYKRYYRYYRYSKKNDE
jgi:hypothetical protein